MSKEWWKKKNDAERKKILMQQKPKKQSMAEKQAKQSTLNFTVMSEEEKNRVKLLDDEIKPAKSAETGKYEWQEDGKR